VGEHRRVDAVGLGADAEGAGEVADAIRTRDHHGQRRRAEGVDEAPLEPTRRVGDDAVGRETRAQGDERADARGGVGHAARGALGPHVHVERGLGHVDADEALGHGGPPVRRTRRCDRLRRNGLRCAAALTLADAGSPSRWGGPGACPSSARDDGSGDLVPR
jgi:hypothetical protein